MIAVLLFPLLRSSSPSVYDISARVVGVQDPEKSLAMIRNMENRPRDTMYRLRRNAKFAIA